MINSSRTSHVYILKHQQVPPLQPVRRQQQRHRAVQQLPRRVPVRQAHQHHRLVVRQLVQQQARQQALQVIIIFFDDEA